MDKALPFIHDAMPKSDVQNLEVDSDVFEDEQREQLLDKSVQSYLEILSQNKMK